MKRITLFIMLIIALNLNAQTLQWAGKYGGNGEDVALSMFADDAGNTYSTGYFTNNCDFDISAGVSVIEHGDDYEVFVSKTSPAGALVWARSFGSTAGDNGTAITADAAGNVYVTGVYQETADFDPGVGTYPLTSSGGLDIFVVKLDVNGDFVWAKSFGGTDYEQATAIGVDANGNILLSGFFYFATDFDPGTSEFMMTPAGSGDGFAVKLSSDGDFVWAKQFGGSEFELATAMKVMGDGSIYITGNYGGSADFNPDAAATFFLNSPVNSEAIYLLHLNNDGGFINALKVCESDFHAYAFGLDLDSQGAAVVSGYYGGNIYFHMPDDTFLGYNSPNYFNSYVVKLDDAGAVAWAKNLDANLGSEAYASAVNSQDEVLVYGFYAGTLLVESSSLTQTTSSAQENFLIKYDSNGNLISTFAFGGSDFIDSAAMALDSDDNIYMSTSLENTVDINPHPDQVQQVTSAGFRDSYIIKMSNEILSLPDVNQLHVAFYPNPTNGLVYVGASSAFVGHTYHLIDMAGRTILKGTLTESGQIDFSGLTSGVYMIKVGEKAYKIIKE